jgi:hypothetical protein
VESEVGLAVIQVHRLRPGRIFVQQVSQIACVRAFVGNCQLHGRILSENGGFLKTAPAMTAEKHMPILLFGQHAFLVFENPERKGKKLTIFLRTAFHKKN